MAGGSESHLLGPTLILGRLYSCHHWVSGVVLLDLHPILRRNLPIESVSIDRRQLTRLGACGKKQLGNYEVLLLSQNLDVLKRLDSQQREARRPS